MKNNKKHLSKILLTVIFNLFILQSAFAQDPPWNGGSGGSNGGASGGPPCTDNSIPYTPEARYGDNHKIIIGGMGGNNDGFINWNARPEPSYGDFAPNNILNGVVQYGTPHTNIWSAQLGMNNVLSRFRINVAPTNCATSPITWNTGLSIAPDGNVGIGTDETFGYRFAVNGGIICKNDIRITTTGVSWPDYVFSTSYILKPLLLLEKEINALGHLPEVPSATEVEEKGISVTEMNTILLKKVEELTLYAIQQQKEIEKMKADIEALKNK